MKFVTKTLDTISYFYKGIKYTSVPISAELRCLSCAM